MPDASSHATGTAPTKACPHCGAMAQTLERRCPHCGKRYRKRTILKVLVGLSLMGLVLIVGCAALVGTAANEAVEQLDAEQRAHAITRAQFDALDLGMSRSAVEAQLGKQPEDRQEFQSEGVLDEEPVNTSCIYYNRAGGSLGDVFQLCFTGDRLDSKNSY